MDAGKFGLENTTGSERAALAADSLRYLL